MSHEYAGTCPTCNSSSSYDPVPLYIALLVMFLIILLLGFMYVKFLLARKETQVCMAFKKMDENTKSRFSDLIRDDKI